MSKIIKTLVFLLIILLLFNLTAFATDINMNLTQEETNTESQNGVTENMNNVDNNTDNGAPTDDVGGDAAPSGVSSIAQENMGFSNILNILIITVGVILILLAIAILIRLKG